ncbi:MAG: substrate-binding domain-containing protein [Gammaproteobacteria bacterium]|nr:substrate-binding domain-containing protein [Gammaproteobacteria bacterium]
MKRVYYFMILLLANTAFAGNGFWQEADTSSSVSGASETRQANSSKSRINVSGSTTVSSVLNLIADQFEQRHKGIRINIAGGGSSSALKAMLFDPTAIGQMSRAMKKKERDSFVQRYGYQPMEFKVAIDALAVYVNKQNPLKQLTISQLAAIFSENEHAIKQWGELKLPELSTAEWKNKVIRLFSLPPTAGAYSLFKKRVLNKAGYKISMISYPISSTIVQATGVNPGAISFASSFYATKRTHFIALQGKDGRFYPPQKQWITSFKYPLARYLYLYINRKPGTPLSRKNQQFLQFLMADGTQTLIQRAGFYSVSDAVRREQSALIFR